MIHTKHRKWGLQCIGETRLLCGDSGAEYCRKNKLAQPSLTALSHVICIYLNDFMQNSNRNFSGKLKIILLRRVHLHRLMFALDFGMGIRLNLLLFLVIKNPLHNPELRISAKSKVTPDKHGNA